MLTLYVFGLCYVTINIINQYKSLHSFKNNIFYYFQRNVGLLVSGMFMLLEILRNLDIGLKSEKILKNV